MSPTLLIIQTLALLLLALTTLFNTRAVRRLSDRILASQTLQVTIVTPAEGPTIGGQGKTAATEVEP